MSHLRLAHAAHARSDSSALEVVERTCCVCDASDFETIARVDRRGEPLQTVICRCCGLISHEQLPAADELARFYRDEYRRDQHGETHPSPRRVMRAWQNGQRIAAVLRPRMTSGARILEVGAGLGCTVKALQQAGFAAAGIDPCRDFTTFSIEQLRAPMSQVALEDFDGEPNWDAVLLVHVLEHFRAPVDALLVIRRLLKPGGTLYVECPNIHAPFAPSGKLFHRAHVYNFSPPTLRALLRRCGFEPVEEFSTESGRDVRMLFRAASARSFTVAGTNADHTRARMRISGPRYVLRPSYLLRRARQLGDYVREFFFAGRYVARLLSECQADESSAPGPTLRHAA